MNVVTRVEEIEASGRSVFWPWSKPSESVAHLRQTLASKPGAVRLHKHLNAFGPRARPRQTALLPEFADPADALAWAQAWLCAPF